MIMRGFVSNRSRLLIGRELAQLPLAGNYGHCFSSRTASDASTTCSRMGTVHFYLVVLEFFFVNKLKMPEMARKLIGIFFFNF